MESGMKIPLTLNLNVDAEATDSDEQLRAKAKSQVNNVLRKIGEVTGEHAWKKLVESLGKPEGSKSSFLREAGNDAVKTSTPAESKEVEKEIFEQLKKQRAEKQ
jgi:hypothetical protein